MTDLLTPIGESFTPRPPRVSVRTLGRAIEDTLLEFTRSDLAVVLSDERHLKWGHERFGPTEADSKRALVDGYISGWEVPRPIALARRIVVELDVQPHLLEPLLAEYDKTGGVGSLARNLIFAVNGPKPELVLRDAVSNDIEIVRNAQHCLVYDREVPADGLRFQPVIDWWRGREELPNEASDTAVGRALHSRPRASLAGNGAEELVLDAYAARYKAHGFGIPARYRSSAVSAAFGGASGCGFFTGSVAQSVDVECGHCGHEFLSLRIEGHAGDGSEEYFGQVDGDGSFLLGDYVLMEE